MTEDNIELVVERRVAASPATVFSFFADRDHWLQWQGVEADIDPQPGGLFRMNVRGDGFASGRFVEVELDRRLVFTLGWEMPGNPGRQGRHRSAARRPTAEFGRRLGRDLSRRQHSGRSSR